jgi:hypothetical protein
MGSLGNIMIANSCTDITVENFAALISSPIQKDAPVNVADTVQAMACQNVMYTVHKTLSGAWDDTMLMVFDRLTGRSSRTRCLPLRNEEYITSEASSSLIQDTNEFRNGDSRWLVFNFQVVSVFVFWKADFRSWQSMFRLKENQVCKFVMKMMTIRGRDINQFPKTGERYTLNIKVTGREMVQIMNEYRCWWCDHYHAKLRQCGGCHAVKYCSTECQAYDWRHGGHRAACDTDKQPPATAAL